MRLSAVIDNEFRHNIVKVWAVPCMGPRVPFAPALLTLSLHITFISSRLFILLYVTCVRVNKAV